MLTITVVVGLLPLVSITVDSASVDTNSPYVIYDATSGEVYASNYPFHVYAAYNNRWVVRGLGALSMTTTTVSNMYIIRLFYNESLGQWVTGTGELKTSSGDYVIVGTTTRSSNYGYVWSASEISNKKIYTNVAWSSNEIGNVASYSNDLTVLPQGLTEDAIRDIVNEQLNTQTAAGNTAQTIINNTTNQYNLYLAGDIDTETMQQNVKNNIDTLSDLTPGTLLDAMQINNGLTYNQTIQDQLLNTASGNVQSMINGYQNTINSAITNYQNGTTSQQDTVNIINQAITNLNNMIINGTAKTTADVNAVNAAINAANANLDSVTGYKDLSQDASDKSQQSDQEELDYLDELTAETTSTVEQLAPSKNFTSGQTGEAQEVLDLIWENEFVKRLLPMCAGFMVVCVVLGIRYKV